MRRTWWTICAVLMKKRSEDSFFGKVSETSRARRQPEFVTFELTYGCNFRCVHCYNPARRGPLSELGTKEIFSILDQFADLGVLTVCFSGGEPLLRPDAFDIFRHARSWGLLLALISNASCVTDAVADRLEEFGFCSLEISIYGATKDVYERVTRVPGSYERFLLGLKRLVLRKLPVVVRMPVLVENVAKLSEAKALAGSFKVRFQYCADVTPKTDGDIEPLRHRLCPRDRARLTLADGGPGIEQPCPTVNQDFISCSCGRSRFAVTPYGEMNLCAAFPIPKYDLRAGTVREGWEVLKQVVDRAQPNERYECPTCGLRARCIQGRNDAWLETGDMSRCLPYFKELARLETEAAS